MPAPEVPGLDERIVATIDMLRVKHRACTARQVAAVLNIDHSYISRRIQLLGAQGIVGFDAKVPGSIHLVDTCECRMVNGQWIPVIAAAQLPSAQAVPTVRLGVDPDRAAAATAARTAKKAAAPARKRTRAAD